MNRKISMGQLKRLVKESENFEWEECVNAISNAVEDGEMTWEEVAREALLYMTKDNIIEMAYANKWDLDLS